MKNIEIKVKMTPRDFFIFIGSMASLYAGAISFLNLLFEIINASFPDALNLNYDYFSSGMRWSIATLIIVFPLYVVFSWFINKDLNANSSKRNLWVRKWLTYLTLFIAGVAIITDLIILINTFLGGEITTRFAFKVLAVFIVAGLAFAYYLYDLRREFEQKTSKIKFLVWAVSFGVLSSIVAGFFIMGSPSVLRMKRFDERRTGDLQNIQYQIVNFYQMKGNLPGALGELQDPISGFNIPADPDGKNSYGYEKVSDLSFKICAGFSLDSDALTNSKREMSGYVPIGSESFQVGENWQHKKGYFCFDRKIDKELYPILKNGKKM